MCSRVALIAAFFLDLSRVSEDLDLRLYFCGTVSVAGCVVVCGIVSVVVSVAICVVVSVSVCVVVCVVVSGIVLLAAARRSIMIWSCLSWTTVLSFFFLPRFFSEARVSLGRVSLRIVSLMRVSLRRVSLGLITLVTILAFGLPLALIDLLSLRSALSLFLRTSFISLVEDLVLRKKFSK